MKVYLENYKTLRLELKNILYICIFFIFLIEFILSDITELFPKASIIGNVVLKLCYSYISALIFYFLVVHFKRQNEKRNYYKVLDRNLSVLLNQGTSLSSTLKKISQEEVFDNLKLEDLKKVLQKIDPNTNFPDFVDIVIGRINWYKYLLYLTQTAQKEIDLIFKNSMLLEAELISLLNELYKCYLFTQIHMFNSGKFANESLDNFESIFQNYFERLYDIQKYKAKEIDKYLK